MEGYMICWVTNDGLKPLLSDKLHKSKTDAMDSVKKLKEKYHDGLFTIINVY